ncbi:MAG: phosphoglucomutase/phosphomannomutase family protein, partial [Bacteroidota bacterium]
MSDIKFGTDGWRAIIAEDFTTRNVARVAEGTALWIKANKMEKAGVVVGHDCRFAGELFTETVVKVLAHHGIRTYLAKGFV